MNWRTCSPEPVRWLAIEGKQIQKPMKSVAEVFGLNDRQLPTPEQSIMSLPAGAVMVECPRCDTTAARQRFLTAYGLPAEAELTAEHVANMKAGKKRDGPVPGHRRCAAEAGRDQGADRLHDMIWSADKSVTVAWALAPTEAERAIIQQAHRTLLPRPWPTRNHIMGETTKGKGGKDGVEKGVTAWMACDHYTSRPTAEVAMTDKDGQEYTEFQTIPMKVADPQLHTHVLWLNSVLTESGRIGAMDRDKLDGLVKELGGVYQAELGAEFACGRDQRQARPGDRRGPRSWTSPSQVTRHFSKRSQDIERAARAMPGTRA